MKKETKNKIKAKIINFMALTFMIFLPIFIFISFDVLFFSLKETAPLNPDIKDTFLYIGLITLFSGLGLLALLINESWYNAWKISHNNFENDEEYVFGGEVKNETI